MSESYYLQPFLRSNVSPVDLNIFLGPITPSQLKNVLSTITDFVKGWKHSTGYFALILKTTKCFH